MPEFPIHRGKNYSNNTKLLKAINSNLDDLGFFLGDFEESSHGEHEIAWGSSTRTRWENLPGWTTINLIRVILKECKKFNGKLSRADDELFKLRQNQLKALKKRLKQQNYQSLNNSF